MGGDDEPSFAAGREPERSVTRSGGAREVQHGRAVEAYLAAGAPPDKLHLGVPFYARSWNGVPAANGGLFQPANGVPRGTWDDWQSGFTGMFDYWDVLRLLGTGAYTRGWDAAAQVPWAYSPTQEGGHFITYEDRESLNRKIDYLLAQNLGGIMLWELSGDVRADPNTSLLQVIADRLH